MTTDARARNLSLKMRYILPVAHQAAFIMFRLAASPFHPYMKKRADSSSTLASNIGKATLAKQHWQSLACVQLGIVIVFRSTVRVAVRTAVSIQHSAITLRVCLLSLSLSLSLSRFSAGTAMATPASSAACSAFAEANSVKACIDCGCCVVVVVVVVIALAFLSH